MQENSLLKSFLWWYCPILTQKCEKFNIKMKIHGEFDKKTTGKIALDDFPPACYALISIGMKIPV